LKKELFAFIGIFIFLATLMHMSVWFSHPLEHIMALPNAGVYGMGAYHPLIFTILVYLIFVLIRSIFRLLKKSIGR